jgi:hypothetical protein
MGVLYLDMCALYNPKLPNWPLIGLPDLAGGQRQHKTSQMTGLSEKQSGEVPVAVLLYETRLA